MRNYIFIAPGISWVNTLSVEVSGREKYDHDKTLSAGILLQHIFVSQKVPQSKNDVHYNQAMN